MHLKKDKLQFKKVAFVNFEITWNGIKYDNLK